MSSKPRILVLQPDKGVAESIFLGIRSMKNLDVEVDVALVDAALVGEAQASGLRLDRYDLLIVATGSGERVLAACEDPPPLVFVGGPPNGSPRIGPELFRVPLPLSFNLLEESVAAALEGTPRQEDDEPRRRQIVG